MGNRGIKEYEGSVNTFKTFQLVPKLFNWCILEQKKQPYIALNECDTEDPSLVVVGVVVEGEHQTEFRMRLCYVVF